MKTDLSKIDREQFLVKEGVVAGETCYLVIPHHIGAKWTRDNMIFRSSMWNSQGELISASFKKFFNWGEQPDLVEHPADLKHCNLPSKIDGSTLIISIYKGELIVRTRGTFNAAEHELTRADIPILKEKYPRAFEFHGDECDYSRVFEWVTPNNRIVIDYGPDIDMYYIAKIKHDDYSYASQRDLDVDAELYDWKRPPTYTFKTISDMVEGIKAMKGVEGICLYYGKDQQIRKIKSLEYLVKHQFKSQASFENVLDMFLEWGCPTYQEFEAKLVETFDYECFTMARGFVSQVCDGYREVKKILEGMDEFILKISTLENRKAQAQAIIQAYGATSRSCFLFVLLDRKPVTNDMIKKLIFQVTKQ
jgi:hypothetical protein